MSGARALKGVHPPTERIVVSDGDAGRIDRFLAARYPKHSRTFFQRLINARGVQVDGHPVSPHQALRPGQTVLITWPVKTPRPASQALLPLPFAVLYEDDALCVVDKPAGLLVHPASDRDEKTTLIDLIRPRIDASGWPDEVRPGLVHRLDRDTSGVVVLAKTPEAHAAVSRQFARRQVEKTYNALVRGRVAAAEGTIEGAIGRDVGSRNRFAVSGSGRWSSTRFRVLERFSDASFVEAYPLTGRTHQIRIHLAGYGHPVLGDPLYGKPASHCAFASRHLLHAAGLRIRHPVSEEQMTFSAPLPADFQSALKELRS